MRGLFSFTALVAVAIVNGIALAQTENSVPAGVARPDFTGVWGTYRAPGQTGFGGGTQPAELPLKRGPRAQLDEYRALVAPNQDTPGGFCLGSGMPGSMLGSGGYPMEIVQHDDIIIIVYEAHAEIRRIYFGEPADPNDLFPDRNGYSLGRWDGDSLIVTTTHLREALDQRQFPHSESAMITERYHLETDDAGTKVLVAEMTLVDDEFYTEPVHATKKWAYLAGVRLLPYECNEPEWERHLEQLRSNAAGN